MKQKEIPFSTPYIDDDEVDEVVKVLKGKWITSGPEVTKFENLVKEKLGVNTAVALSSGTAALEVSLAVLGVGEGDEVITTACTFASTALAIIHLGASPVLVDVERDTFNIDPGKIEALITEDYELLSDGLLVSRKTKKVLRGILPVHYGGQPAEMDAINGLAKKYGLFVIEDAAHAIGAAYKGIQIGKTGNLVCFSFYSNKNITTGEGGMIVTDNETEGLEQKIRRYSLHGLSKNTVERYKTGLPFYDIVCPGYKANLTDLQAALGVVQIKKLARITELRNQLANWYDESLRNIDGITIPVIHGHNRSARHLYPILVSPDLKPHRDDIIMGLREKKIFPSVHFIPVHFHSYFKEYYWEHLKEKIVLPVTEDLFYREISLPLFPGMEKEDVRCVSEALKEIIGTF